MWRRYPFTIILKYAIENPILPNLTLKIDPGSKVTGLAIGNEDKVVWAGELEHRGKAIKAALASRRVVRRSRRSRKTRYRKPRFLNRGKSKGWLAPSLQHRVETTMTWVNRLRCYAPIASVAQELVKFDTQKMHNPEISGVEYQQGELAGYEVREYLLEKWDRKCAYCGKENVPLEVEHIIPRSRNGTDCVSNLTLACKPCNDAKGIMTAAEFGHLDVQAQAKQPLGDAAAVNATRWALFNQLKETGLPVDAGTGGRTKYNRCRLGLPKAHWIDAACVGKVETLSLDGVRPLLIKCCGHGKRQMCRTDKYGLPSRYVPRFKFVKGFQTGDLVKAVVTTGKNIGVYGGRVAVRSTGRFNIVCDRGLVQGISYRCCEVLFRKDGYSYRGGLAHFSPLLKQGVSCAEF